MDIRKGNYDEIHVHEKSNVDLMVGNWKYQAYQAGYITWGFFIQWLSFAVVILLFMWLFYLPFTLPIGSILC